MTNTSPVWQATSNRPSGKNAILPGEGKLGDPGAALTLEKPGGNVPSSKVEVALRRCLPKPCPHAIAERINVADTTKKRSIACLISPFLLSTRVHRCTILDLMFPN